LKKLFYDPTVEVLMGANSRALKTVSIPIDKRIYVIEDMDCLDGENEFLMRRDVLAKTRDARNAREEAKTKERDRRVSGYGDDDDNARIDLDLATILNVLDGTLETPGRVILITSNHPEKLDHALIRPGRIDGMIEFGLASLDVIRRMYENFYDCTIDDKMLTQIKPMLWTPAEISQVFFRHFENPEDGLTYLIEKTPHVDFRRFETEASATVPSQATAPSTQDLTDISSSAPSRGLDLENLLQNHREKELVLTDPAPAPTFLGFDEVRPNVSEPLSRSYANTTQQNEKLKRLSRQSPDFDGPAAWSGGAPSSLSYSPF
jgi:hypothetical protein